MPTPTAIDPISASLRLIIERMHKHVGDRLYDLRSEAEAILPITCIEATTPAKPGADGKKSLASALLSKLAAHLDPAQARIALAALDAEQAPARQAARDLFNRTLDTDHPGDLEEADRLMGSAGRGPDRTLDQHVSLLRRADDLEADMLALRGAYLEAAGTNATLVELVGAVRRGADPEVERLRIEVQHYREMGAAKRSEGIARLTVEMAAASASRDDPGNAAAFAEAAGKTMLARRAVGLFPPLRVDARPIGSAAKLDQSRLRWAHLSGAHSGMDVRPGRGAGARPAKLRSDSGSCSLVDQHVDHSMTEQTDTADATRFMVPAGCVDARPTAYRAWRSLGYTPMQCLAVVYGQPSLYLLGSECPSARSGASPRHTSRCAVASACP